MNFRSKSLTRLIFSSIVAVVAGGAWAQAPAPAAAKAAAESSAQMEAGEPRADTSAPPSPPAAESTPVASGRPVAHAASPKAAAPAGHAAPKGNDRLDLGTATVTGDREQPKVMYIVPWKRSDIGDLSGKPMNSLLDEALAPVDRDEFRREVAYYGAVKATSQDKGGAANNQVEK